MSIGRTTEWTRAVYVFFVSRCIQLSIHSVDVRMVIRNWGIILIRCCISGIVVVDSIHIDVAMEGKGGNVRTKTLSIRLSLRINGHVNWSIDVIKRKVFWLIE